MKEKGLLPTVLNSANEAAVELFLKDKIKFFEIFEIVENEVVNFKNVKDLDLDTVLKCDKEIKDKILKDRR